MKDYRREELEEGRPNQESLHCVNFVLDQLFKDREHVISDRVAGCCTYEELIGALLLARDDLRANLPDDYDEEEIEDEENEGDDEGNEGEPLKETLE